MNWFDVDKTGLGKLIERRGKFFAIGELISNAWDTNAKSVAVRLDPVEGLPFVKLTVIDDDPDGFKNLTHAWTLFAESEKKGDATKRGRFNLGEKLVLALAVDAEIITTTGGVAFDKDGRRTLRRKRDQGSQFSARIRMTREELGEALRICHSLLVPPGVTTFLNSELLRPRDSIGVVAVSLPTETADEEGILRRSRRQTWVEIFEPASGEVPSLYELGIPVCPTEDRWHYNVQQKVPLNFERDGVTPGYLREVRTAVVDHMQDKLRPVDASAPWVRDALADDELSPEAAGRIMDLRFGARRVAYDPSDPEANNAAVAKGYTVVHGGTLSSAEWENVKRAGAILPAGQVTPTPKPFSPGGEPLVMIDPDRYSAGEVWLAAFAHQVAIALGIEHLSIQITRDTGWGFAATFAPESHRMILNTGNGVPKGLKRDALLIHEFAHGIESNHLDEKYHDALCELGAKFTELALSRPELWRGEP